MSRTTPGRFLNRGSALLALQRQPFGLYRTNNGFATRGGDPGDVLSPSTIRTLVACGLAAMSADGRTVTATGKGTPQ